MSSPSPSSSSTANFPECEKQVVSGLPAIVIADKHQPRYTNGGTTVGVLLGGLVALSICALPSTSYTNIHKGPSAPRRAVTVHRVAHTEWAEPSESCPRTSQMLIHRGKNNKHVCQWAWTSEKGKICERRAETTTLRRIREKGGQWERNMRERGEEDGGRCGWGWRD